MGKLRLVIFTASIAVTLSLAPLTNADPAAAAPGTSAQVATPATVTPQTPTPAITSHVSSSVTQGPCKALKQACKAAGFYRHGHKEGKGIYKDCIKPLLDNQSVPGVSIAPDDIKNCQAKLNAHKGQD